MTEENKQRADDGTFLPGKRYSKETELKQGEHWREEKPYYEKEWLEREYVEKARTTGEIADQFGVTDSAIFYWMRKHGIDRRDMTEVRENKYWGVSGEDNGMYGATGEDNPNWKGGVTPSRQKFYSSIEWRNVAHEVWKRDEATCQRCGKEKESEDEKFDIHHIISFAVEETRAELDNLVLLCDDCHDWVHSNENTNNEYIEEIQTNE